MKRFIAMLALSALTALTWNAPAQTNTITVTNVVTLTVTNFVTVTNLLAETGTPTNTAAITATNELVPAPKYPWETSVGVGLTLTRGNSDTLLVSANIQTHKKTPENELTLGANGAYGENNSVQSVNTVRGFSQFNHLFNERCFTYLRADALHDGIADLQYRITVGPGVGYNFIQATNTTLAGEVGPSFVNQRLGGVDDNYATLRLAERFEHRFSSRGARVWQNVEFLPQVNKLENYLINAEIGIEASVTKKCSLRTLVQDNYASQPASGRERNDVRLVSGINYKF